MRRRWVSGCRRRGRAGGAVSACRASRAWVPWCLHGLALASSRRWCVWHWNSPLEIQRRCSNEWVLASLPAVAGLIYFYQLNRQIENARTNNADASELKSAGFSRILLIKLSGLGDVVHTLPVLVKLRARYPAARIDWLITPENAEIVRCHPALSNVVLFERRDFSKRGRRWRAVLAFLDLLKQISRAKYDLVIDLHGQARSAFFALVSGAPARI